VFRISKNGENHKKSTRQQETNCKHDQGPDVKLITGTKQRPDNIQIYRRVYRSQWPRLLRRGSVAARLLGLPVLFPAQA
jgi:hypothetical protein